VKLLVTVAAKRPAYERALLPWTSPPTDMSRLADTGYVTVGPIAPKSRWGSEDAAARSEAPTKAEAEEASALGGIPLFNGRDLSGWRAAGAAAVEDGALVTRRGGDLYYKADWKTVTMSFTAKATGDGVVMGLQLGQTGMGRGAGSILLAFYADGDMHVRAGGATIGKAGSGKVDLSTWTALRVELTRSSLKLYAGDVRVADVDVSRVPLDAGGVYLYSSGNGEAAVKELNVDGRP
jgi:hypothetical protein